MKIDTYSGFLSDFADPTAPVLGQAVPAATTPVIAQQFEDNFFDHSGDILGNFVESGQLWALLIGIVVGYVIRGVTTY
ncbi:hypothetical protein IQ260_01990 [Leptolyngbya cf. ectocarpi LEGE 11479]|uniref:Uncharacterized protein n=1 Tax=Leptolyngbya cf. ectocarpi LEGE 11479 TaxID=1828722 RepID=A0A928X1Q4_LEPEC|nr:hypothetical protein [Leptolyngbya ectocarpi]MBE9065418.1 hypothetical protein [Leptolyngbya cf. ectocarpi LEGE 11479]